MYDFFCGCATVEERKKERKKKSLCRFKLCAFISFNMAGVCPKILFFDFYRPH